MMGEAKRRREAIARGEPDPGLKGWRNGMTRPVGLAKPENESTEKVATVGPARAIVPLAAVLAALGMGQAIHRRTLPRQGSR